MIYTLLMAQQPSSGASSSGGSGLMTFLPIIIMFALLYFLMILPQQKKQKEHQKMLDSLQVNDKVVTNSGIYGRIVSFKPDKNTIMLEIDETNKIRIEVLRGAVASLITPPANTQS